MDYIACGYPDMSYHGTKAWYPDFSNYSRVLGILICGEYAVPFSSNNSNNKGMLDVKDRYKKTYKDNDSYFYFGYNMHWEKHDFEIPKLPNGYEWKILVDTSDDELGKCIENSILTVDDRSIVVLESSKVIKDTVE